jgi:hypothetical protein
MLAAFRATCLIAAFAPLIILVTHAFLLLILQTIHATAQPASNQLVERANAHKTISYILEPVFFVIFLTAHTVQLQTIAPLVLVTL